MFILLIYYTIYVHVTEYLCEYLLFTYLVNKGQRSIIISLLYQKVFLVKDVFLVAYID